MVLRLAEQEQWRSPGSCYSACFSACHMVSHATPAASPSGCAGRETACLSTLLHGSHTASLPEVMHGQVNAWWVWQSSSSSTPPAQHALPVRMLPLGSREAIWSATAPMPRAGRQLEPVARQRMTKVKRREVTRRLRSKKMPPRKGWKKRVTMASLKPSSWHTMVCQLCAGSWSCGLSSQGLGVWDASCPVACITQTVWQ